MQVGILQKLAFSVIVLCLNREMLQVQGLPVQLLLVALNCLRSLKMQLQRLFPFCLSAQSEKKKSYSLC